MALAGVQSRDAPRETGSDLDSGDLAEMTDARLQELLPTRHAGETPVLFDAARHALLSLGKRVRPVMSMMACAYAGGRPTDALDYGCAVEMAHAASLVLDDLPCMDDARLRRGTPTVHRVHGEDAAVLAAVALLNQAHRTILHARGLAPQARLSLLDELTGAVGFDGLSHGQIRDLRDAETDRSEYGLRRLNHLKTGALFVAAVRGGGLVGGGDAERLSALAAFGEVIGFAFQLCDDLQDATATTCDLGKDIAQDRGKVTFVDLWGVGRVKLAVRQALERAQEMLGDECALSAYAWRLFRNAGFVH